MNRYRQTLTYLQAVLQIEEAKVGEPLCKAADTRVRDCRVPQVQHAQALHAGRQRPGGCVREVVTAPQI